MNSKNTQKGFTILVAVVTAGILLIIAMSIGGVALKEQVLSTANKESQIAFYAADTGMECALYWDLKDHGRNIFSPTDDGTYPVNNVTTVTISCGNSSITTERVSIDTAGTVKHYNYVFLVPGIVVAGGLDTTCALVQVVKTTGDNSLINGGPQRRDVDKIYTDIYSYGYNTCNASLNRLERGIEGHY